MGKQKRNLNFEEVILQLGRLFKRGDKKTARNSMERISKVGKINETGPAIIRMEKEKREGK